MSARRTPGVEAGRKTARRWYATHFGPPAGLEAERQAAEPPEPVAACLNRICGRPLGCQRKKCAVFAGGGTKCGLP